MSINTRNFPAIYNPQVAENVSERYQFADTASVITSLEGHGFQVRSATQRGKGPSGKHMVRLVNPDMKMGNDSTLEVILRNAHNGTSTLSLNMGVYRFVCSNGMVVGDDLIQPLRLRHTGDGFQLAIEDALMQIDEQRRLVAEQIRMMQGISLNQGQILEMGREAIRLVYPTKEDRAGSENALAYVTPRRAEDTDNTVWTVYNRVQESAMRGGRLLVGMRRIARPILNLDRDFSVNQKLWQLGVETAKKAA